MGENHATYQEHRWGGGTTLILNTKHICDKDRHETQKPWNCTSYRPKAQKETKSSKSGKTQFNNDNNNLVEKNLSDHSHAKPRDSRKT